MDGSVVMGKYDVALDGTVVNKAEFVFAMGDSVVAIGKSFVALDDSVVTMVADDTVVDMANCVLDLR